MAITTAINDLFSSIYELIASILGTFYAVIHSVINAILGLVQGFFTLVSDVLSGVVDVAGGIGRFLASTFDPSPATLFEMEQNGKCWFADFVLP